MSGVSLVLNASLLSSEGPKMLKNTVVRLHLKKPALNVSEFGNYKPVSNNIFVGQGTQLCSSLATPGLSGIIPIYLDSF